jgi:hypothetical protein
MSSSACIGLRSGSPGERHKRPVQRHPHAPGIMLRRRAVSPIEAPSSAIALTTARWPRQAVEMPLHLALRNRSLGRLGRQRLEHLVDRHMTAAAAAAQRVDHLKLRDGAQPGAVPTWMGLWAPKGTSKIVVPKLNAAVTDALANPVVSKRLIDLGHELFPTEQRTPEALADFQKSEAEKWWPIVKAAGVK